MIRAEFNSAVLAAWADLTRSEFPEPVVVELYAGEITLRCGDLKPIRAETEEIGYEDYD